MKILVTELPSKSKECIFNKNFNDTRSDGCILSDNRSKCRIEDADFTCPYLQKFKASLRESVSHSENIVKIIPITLEEA